MRDFRHGQCMEVAKVGGPQDGALEDHPRNLESLHRSLFEFCTSGKSHISTFAILTVVVSVSVVST